MIDLVNKIGSSGSYISQTAKKYVSTVKSLLSEHHRYCAKLFSILGCSQTRNIADSVREMYFQSFLLTSRSSVYFSNLLSLLSIRVLLLLCSDNRTHTNTVFVKSNRRFLGLVSSLIFRFMSLFLLFA
jgi:hypothetical protein